MHSRLAHTHTQHASSKKHGIFNPKHILIYLSKQKRAKHINEKHTIHLKQNNNLNMAASISSNKTYQKQNINILETLIIHLKTLSQKHEHC